MQNIDTTLTKYAKLHSEGEKVSSRYDILNHIHNKEESVGGYNTCEEDEICDNNVNAMR